MEGKAPSGQENGPGIKRGAQAPPPINQEGNIMLTDCLYLAAQLAKVATVLAAGYVVTYFMLAI